MAVITGHEEVVWRFGVHLRLSTAARFCNTFGGFGPHPEQIACGPASHDVTIGEGEQSWLDPGGGEMPAWCGRVANRAELAMGDYPTVQRIAADCSRRCAALRQIVG